MELSQNDILSHLQKEHEDLTLKKAEALRTEQYGAVQKLTGRLDQILQMISDVQSGQILSASAD